MNPGDAKDAGKDAVNWDDGLVVSLMWAPGFPPEAGAEERRRDVVDVFIAQRIEQGLLTQIGRQRTQPGCNPNAWFHGYISLKHTYYRCHKYSFSSQSVI